MILHEYEALCNRLCTSVILRPYKEQVLSLPRLTVKQRAAVAKLCRSQCYPPRGSTLEGMVQCLPTNFLRSILPACQTPLSAGLILQMVLWSPMDSKTIDDIYTESMIKEMKVMESVKRESQLNFEPFFGAYNEPVHSLIPHNPAVAQYIHRGIDSWIESITKQVLFPRISSKTISKMTEAEVRNYDCEYEQHDSIGMTAIDLERIYHREGVKIMGPCEMRQKWYPSNLQPRTYYAQGGSAHHSSKYLAKPLTDLADILPSTNRRTRVEPGRIEIRTVTDDVAYYDLSSFTSNFHEHAAFMMRLSKYCDGVEVTVLDSRDGMITDDLGRMLREYTEVNLLHPEYTLPRKYEDPSVVHYHSVAGFLGVYGNIATATFLHGAVMAMLHDYLDESNVAGDDGLDVTPSVDYTYDVACLLGTLQKEKVFRASEGGCIHLKRPITRIGRRLLHGNIHPWPSLEQGRKSGFDARYPYMENLTTSERRTAIAGSITAFLRSLINQVFSEDEIALIDTFLMFVYSTYGLPLEGCVPQCTNTSRGFVPAYERRFIGMDPITNTIQRSYTGIATLPRREWLPVDLDMLNEEQFVCNSSKMMNHLQMLGYVEQEKQKVLVFGEDGLAQLIKEYIDPDPTVYTYTVTSTLPLWSYDYLSRV